MPMSATGSFADALRALRGTGDTIAAIATAPGRGAIALVRMSGSRANEIAARAITPWPIDARVATLCAVRDPIEKTLVDRALVTRFEHGASFTGEQSVEISTHGGLVTPALVLAALLSAGARQALPGEFTRRAVMNGTLDLAQAEAIGDVIDATSRAGHRAALETLDGGLSRRVLALRDALLEVEALIAYEIDFPEEDDGPIAPERIREATARAHAAITALLSTAPTGELVRAGALVVIAGPPNAGKSSLFNALLGEARALVTPVPGTTRDAIEAVVDGRRWPLRLVDTAGLRETTDLVERLGIEVSERYLGRAEAVLACGERPDDVVSTAARVASMTDAPVIGVLTKTDRSAGSDDEPTSANATSAIATSAETGAGLTAVLEAIEEVVSARHGHPALDAPVLTRARHVAALRQAGDELARFMETWAAGALPAPVAAVHLRAAVAALEELVGAVDVEDVLDRVFRTFCVGK
jgi:tRNA modification GTPase